MIKNYSLGLDVGIGSVGVAVIDNDKQLVEYLNSRIFDSSENAKTKDSICQDRRGSRGVRRNIRRRHHRKERLKWLFAKYGITTQEKLNAWYRNGNAVYEKLASLGLSETFSTRDIYPLRAIALDYELSNEELSAIMIHICNHRGYRPFYEEDVDKSEKKLMQGRSNVKEIIERDEYRTIGEMYALAPEFKNRNEMHKNYTYARNTANSKHTREEFYLIERSQVEEEARLILEKQKEFNPILAQEIEATSQGEKVKTTVSDRILEIIFSQRDFEDGPSTDYDSKGQKYHGFGKDNGGYCTIYKNEKRGIRASLLGDLYATTNLMSQYTYIDTGTGEIGIGKELAEELVKAFIENGELSDAAFKTILKAYHFKCNKNSAETTFSKCNKFTKDIKALCDKYNVSWNDLVGDISVSTDTKIHKLATLLAYNVTPKRREKELKKLGFIPDEMCKAFGKNFGGTAMVSDKFMIESIEAFMNGEIYGDFQARKNEELENRAESAEKPVKIPKIEDIDIIKNPVVFRSINETRKMVNAIIEKYGSPSSISVEVATDLNQSKEAKSKEAKRQNGNQKKNDELRREIAEKWDRSVNSVTKKEIDRYKLYLEQEGKCMYSGKPLEVEKLFDACYEVDHIIPFSLILDDTLNNKCLVLRDENQKKGQRTPLQYFKERNLEDRISEYMSRASAMSKNISKIKLEYLRTPDIYQDELFDRWKSRNINDTRYIAKYVASMLSGIKINNGGSVITIKGGITSRFRRWWLVRAKSEIECYKYIEKIFPRLADIDRKYADSDDEKKPMWEIERKQLIDEWTKEAQKEYGFGEEYTRSLIESNMLEKNRDNNLHHGVDAAILACLNNKYIQIALDNYKLYQIWLDGGKPDRKYGQFIENYEGRRGILPYFDEYLEKSVEKLKKYFYMSENDAKIYLLRADKIPCRIENFKDQILVRTYDQDEKTFKELCGQVYDKKYAETLQLPLVSRKPQRSLRGTVSDDMPLPKSENDGSFYVKNIGIDFAGNKNETVIPDNKYYCVEVYKDEEGFTRVRGIRRSNVVKKDGKLYLNCQNPEGYKEHIMYLFKNDYIEIRDDKGNIKIEGYYQSIKAITRCQFYIIKNNSAMADIKTISAKDTVTKYNVDILGRKGGEIKCGGHSLSILPKE